MFIRTLALVSLCYALTGTAALASRASDVSRDSLQNISPVQTADTTKASKQENAIRFGYSFGPDFGLVSNGPFGFEYFVSYQHNDRIYTLRHITAADVNSYIPSETINETAIMYGICTTYRGLLLTASAGLGYQENSIRRKYLYSQPDSMQIFQMNSSHSLGLAMQFSATAETWRFLNLGFCVYADLNTVLLDYGITFRWQFNIYL